MYVNMFQAYSIELIVEVFIESCLKSTSAKEVSKLSVYCREKINEFGKFDF